MVAVVSDEELISKILQFEIALAKAQAKKGLIPKKAAAEIALKIPKIKISTKDLIEGTYLNGIPIIPILSIIRENLTSDTKTYLHFGATSQDAMDTATVLMIRDVLLIMEKRLNDLNRQLDYLTKRFGDVPCMAHSRWQQAIPITFGVKINAWRQPLQRQLSRLSEIKQRLLCVQLGGAVGTLAVYGNKGKVLIDELAKELKLKPSLPWHSQRDTFCEFTNWLAMLTGILGKMGADILVMAQSEVDEIIENEKGGKSSAMPHKNNPVLSEALVALARINSSLQSQQLQSLVHTSERDATAWILEWNAMPQMIINASVCLKHALTIGKSMKVKIDVMKRNVDQFLKNNHYK